VRILFLAPDVNLDEHDGQSVHTLAICRAFASLGHQVLLLVSGGFASTLQSGLEVAHIRNSGRGARMDVRRVSNRFDPEVVYERRPSPKLGFYVSRRMGIPLFLEINGLVSQESESGAVRARWPRMIVRRYLLSRCTKIFVPAPGLAKAIATETGLDLGRFVAVPNGVDLSVFKPLDVRVARRSLSWPDGGWIITFVGKLVPWQGLETLLDAASLLRNRGLLWVLVGDGPLRDSIRRGIEERGLIGTVRMVGAVAHSQVPFAIAASDLCVAPFSRGRNDLIEISPLKIFEYMAMARPVIASNVPGVQDIVQEAGLVIEGDNAQTLAHAVESLLADSKKRERMSRFGLEYARSASWESRAKSILETISRAVPGPQRNS